MKKVIVILVLLLSICLSGCDSNKTSNVVINSDGGWYVNTSESINVNSYNGYRLIESNSTINEDGSIVVMLKFNKPIK